MADGLPAVSEELAAEINALTEDSWSYYKSKRSAEKQVEDNKMMEKFAADEEFKNQRMAEMVELWNAADADGDGRLNEAEWMNWCKA